MFRTILCLLVYSKAFRNLHSQVAPKPEAWKGLHNFFSEVSDIYTITTEKLRPRYFLSMEHSSGFSGNMSKFSPEQEPSLGGTEYGSPHFTFQWCQCPGYFASWTFSSLVKWGQYYFMKPVLLWWGSYLKIKLFQIGSVLENQGQYVLSTL